MFTSEDPASDELVVDLTDDLRASYVKMGKVDRRWLDRLRSKTGERSKW
jgi:hypothetical protein